MAFDVLMPVFMTLPRQVLPGTFYMLTRRCTQRQFLLRPDDETNNAFAYCLAEAAQRFEIELVVAQQMSNHHHTTFFDRHGRVIEFVAHFHKMLAKCQNALRGRWENMWSSEPPCLVELVEPADVIAKAIYTATNPVLDDLVERVSHWPGARTVRALLRQESIVAVRPRHFFRGVGPMPDTATLTFSIPAELGEASDVLAQLRDGIARVELEQSQRRLATGLRILGRRAVLKQSWRDSPKGREPRRNLRPRIAASSKWYRIEAISRNREFLAAYRIARARWLKNEPVVFPPGTYWLVRFAGATAATLQN